MSTALFLPAILALLCASGPTNTLMAVAGAKLGLRRAALLKPAEVCGYMSVVLLLSYLGENLVEKWPDTALALKGLAAAWVLFLAFSLWRAIGRDQMRSSVTSVQVFLTTLFNPKALVVGGVLLPAPRDDLFLPELGLFGLSVVVVAFGWSVVGRLTQFGNRSPQSLLVFQRSASVWLAFVSGALMVSALSTSAAIHPDCAVAMNVFRNAASLEPCRALDPRLRLIAWKRPDEVRLPSARRRAGSRLSGCARMQVATVS